MSKQPHQNAVKAENDDEADSSRVVVRRNVPSDTLPLLHLVNNRTSSNTSPHSMNYGAGSVGGITAPPPPPPPPPMTPSTTMAPLNPIPRLGFNNALMPINWHAVSAQVPTSRSTSASAIVSWSAGLIVTSSAQSGGVPPRAPLSNYGSNYGSLGARLNLLIPPQYTNSTVLSPLRAATAGLNRNRAFAGLRSTAGGLVDTSPQRRKRNKSDLEAGTSSSSATKDNSDIPPPCCICNRQFYSWNALYGHMRCHPSRPWRGINPPPDMNIDGTLKTPEQIQLEQQQQQQQMLQNIQQPAEQIEPVPEQPQQNTPDGALLDMSSATVAGKEKVVLNVDLNVVPEKSESPPADESPVPSPPPPLLLNEHGEVLHEMFDLNKSPPKEE